ncbi:MAG: HEAT repeat domain-containing protein [Woeseia sp.]
MKLINQNIYSILAISSFFYASQSAASECRDVHAYNSQTYVVSDFDGKVSHSQLMLRAQLHSRVLAQSAEHLVVGFQLSEAGFEQEGEQGAVPKYLLEPFAVDFGAEGSIVKVWHVADRSSEFSASLEGLIRPLQHARRQLAKSYARDENDGLGDVLVRFDVAPDGWQAKQRIEYKRLVDSSGKGMQEIARILSDSTSLRPNDCWLDAAGSDTSLSIPVAGMPNYRQDITQSIDVDTARPPLPEEVATIELYRLPDNPDEWLQAWSGKSKADIATLTSEDRRRRLDELSALEGSDDLMAVRGWLLFNDAHVEELVSEALRELDFSEGLRSTLISEIAHLEIPAGTRLLNSLLVEEGYARNDRIRAAVAVGQTRLAQGGDTFETIQELWAERAVANDSMLADTLVLAAGSLAAGSRHDTPEEADAVTEWLLSELAAAHNAGEQVLLINALANADSSAVTPVLWNFVDSNNEFVRNNAVEAIGRRGDPEQNERLIARMAQMPPSSHEAIAYVAKAQVDNGADLSPASVRSLTSIGSTSADSSTRLLIVDALAASSPSSETATALKEFGQSAKSREELQSVVRALAAQNRTTK